MSSKTSDILDVVLWYCNSGVFLSQTAPHTKPCHSNNYRCETARLAHAAFFHCLECFGKIQILWSLGIYSDVMLLDTKQANGNVPAKLCKPLNQLTRVLLIAKFPIKFCITDAKRTCVLKCTDLLKEVFFLFSGFVIHVCSLLFSYKRNSQGPLPPTKSQNLTFAALGTVFTATTLVCIYPRLVEASLSPFL